MNTKREIYLLNQSVPEIFDPRTHVIYPFTHFTSFNRHYWVKGVEYIKDLTCDYCGEVFEGNSGGYYCAYIIFNSRDDVRLNCGCDRSVIDGVPDDYDQQYGFHKAVEFPKELEGSVDHLVAWRMAGNKFHLNKYIGKPFTTAELFKTKPDFGCGGSMRGEFRIEYTKNIVCIQDDNWKVIKKLTRTDIAKLVDEILDYSRPQPRKEPVQLELFA